MKYLFTLFIALFVVAVGYAQPDNGTTTVVIPRLKDPEVKANNEAAKTAEPRFKAMEFATSVMDDDKKYTFPKEGNSTFQIGESKDMTPEKFANPREIPGNALPKGQGDENTKVFRRNQSFGEFRTKSNTVRIICRDHMAEDGDLVKVMVNSMVVNARVYLTNGYKTITLGLTPGFNKIEFEALNQGTSGPNTAEFQIYDEKANKITGNQWDLATGFKGSVMIIKEE
ncbi:hypothetical protein [Flavobacterium sp.]|uniref:hypothetical protein n=1 Tax=Flavobacterium sp. TaxID=239 RepID=UPI0028BE501D|nr:hypothetical protein [Flavobacterium sp.]